MWILYAAWVLFRLSHEKQTYYMWTFYFVARVKEKSSLKWMFTECLQSTLAQFFCCCCCFVTDEVMKPFTCGAMQYLWRSKCMCCTICIKINYVCVACSVFIATPLIAQKWNTGPALKIPQNKFMHRAMESISVWENQVAAGDPH